MASQAGKDFLQFSEQQAARAAERRERQAQLEEMLAFAEGAYQPFECEDCAALVFLRRQADLEPELWHECGGQMQPVE